MDKPTTPVKQTTVPCEYRILSIPGSSPDLNEVAQEMTALGMDGWRLVSASGRYLYFEREVSVV